MADWPALLARRERTLAVRCYLSDKPVKALSGAYDYGWDSVSGAVSVQLAELYPWIPQAGILRLELGWDGYTQQVAKALVSSKDPSWWPLENTIQAQGYLSRAQHPYSGDVTYTAGNSDQGIVSDLLAKSRVPHADVQGQNLELLSVADYELKDGFTPWSAIEEVDRVTAYKTFETPGDGTVRRRLIYLGIPSSGYAYSYEEGENYVQIRRKQGIEGYFNRVIVEGLAGEDISVIRRTDTTLVPRDYTERVSSELIQTEAHADAVGAIKLLEGARVVDVLEIRTPGDPRVQPGQTCRVLAPEIGITAWANYYVRHVHGEFGPQGWWLTLTVEGGTGTAGYLEPLPPEAVFEFTVTRETVEIGGVQSTIYTVMCDAALSYDPDGLVVGWSWSNNKNADTGSASTYATYFTQAQAENATLPAITLEVTDNGDPALTGTITLDIDVEIEAVTVRQLYVAARSRAEATPSGGAAWNTHTPASGLVLSTPDRAGEDHSYWGKSGGDLLYTGDNLATAPTVVHTFLSQINTVSVCESNASRVAVGLENGQVWATDDAQNLAEAIWARVGEFAAPVLWLTENPFSPGLYGVSSGSGFYLLYGSVGTATGWFALDTPDTARKHVGSPFANYGCGTLGEGSASTSPVKREDGVAVTFPVVSPAVTDVWAIAHHAREDVLYAADDDLSGNARVWVKAAGATEFTLLATITGAGFPRHLKGDGDHPQVFYLACDDGLYKSFDACQTWFRMRDYSGDDLAGLQVGFGAASWEAELPPGTGKRVYILGTDINGAGAYFRWTEDIFTESPVWQENNTGLETVGVRGASMRLHVDPFHPGERVIAYTHQPYINDNVRGGGEWRPLLPFATAWAAILAISEGFSEGNTLVHIGEPAFSAHEEGFIAVVVSEQGYWTPFPYKGQWRHAWLLHTHDYGAHWTAAYAAMGGLTTLVPSQVCAGSHDTDTLYAWIGSAWASGAVIVRSFDGGHTCLLAGSWPTTTEASWRYLVTDPHDATDRTAMLIDGANPIQKTTDGFANLTAQATYTNVIPLWAPDDPSFTGGYQCDLNGAGANGVWRGASDGLSSELVFTPSDPGSSLTSVHHLDCFASNYWLMANGTKVQICRSSELATWVDKTGDAFGGTMKQANAIAVDPLS